MKYVPKVYVPKGVKIVNHSNNKLTPRQSGFAKWQVSTVKKSLKMK